MKTSSNAVREVAFATKGNSDLKQKSEALCLELFGKKVEDMNAEEAIRAISVVAARLADKTGEEKYKRIERASMSALKGNSTERVIEDAFDENSLVRH